MNIKIFIFSIISLFLFLLCNKEEKESLPNFIIIFADDLGYGDLGCFGHPTIKTPNLDRMAQKGLKMTQFYVAASICTPSRAGLLTGKLPIRTGMCGKRGVLFPDSGGGLQTSEMTIAKALKRKNYQTACIGKWHLGHLAEYLPTKHGFDYYFGIPYSNDMSPAQSNWDYAKENFPPTPLIENDSIIEREPDQSQLTARYTEKAINFIKDNKDQAFFLYMPHTFPHIPLYIDSLHAGRSKRGIYGDVVEVLDLSVGKILSTLEEYHLEENTFVLFTSDNGPWGWAGINGGSQGLLKGKKGSPWEGGFRVPAIAQMPNTIPANTTSDAIVTALDIFPTLLHMAGIDISDFEKIDGKDISLTFTQQEEVQQEVYYYRNTDLVAYRKAAWKIFLKDPDPWNNEFVEKDLPLLFNLNEDPSEQFNLAKQFPNIVAELTQAATTHINTVEVVPSQLDSISIKFIKQ